MSQSSYRRLTFALPASGEELLVAELWELGTLGVEIRPGGDGQVVAVAYFAAAAAGHAATLVTGGARLLAEEELPPTDWLAVYRRGARPIAVGRRLWVDPAEPGGGQPAAEAGPPGRRLLRLPAREAFGTGSHETTRLAVELMEEMDFDGLRVLDLGTGSGILAFAALIFGARSVVALELDLASALLAGENRRLNRLQVAIVAGSLEALVPAPNFDIALINILPEKIDSRLAELPGRLRPGGQVVFSGLLREVGPRIEERLSALGLARRARRSLGEWVAYRLRLE